MKKIVPIIVSGGQGSRLWPMSRSSMPKQFIPIGESGKSLFQQTLERVDNKELFLPPLVICSKDHRFLVRDIAKNMGIKSMRTICEPIARNTAPAFCAGVLAAEDMYGEDVAVLILPADHFIPDARIFQDTIVKALPLLEQGKIITFGIHPTSPHTGYGYIERAEAVGAGFGVKSFTEKPNIETAQKYLSSGQYFWNAGIFMVRPVDFIKEMKAFQPDVYTHVVSAYKDAEIDLDDYILNQNYFESAPKISFDYAVMEHTQDSCVVPADFTWYDLGSWDALWDISLKDDAENVIIGDVIAHQTSQSYLSSQRQLLCTVGMDNIIVVATDDCVLVAPRQESERIKGLIETMSAQKRSELHHGQRIFRPWGYYEGIESSRGVSVRKVVVYPGKSLKTQQHHFRSEHWVIIKGSACVTIGDVQTTHSVGNSIDIPVGSIHSLKNESTESDLELIEVQVGDIINEDDVIRYS